LSASDTRANSPAADAFDFTQPPRKFHRFRYKHGASTRDDAAVEFGREIRSFAARQAQGD
jgi:hypothetical protein